jgi:hypothetical protein
MPKPLGVYIKTSLILFLSITIGKGKEDILLRWLEPENGQAPEKWLPDEKLRQKIRVIVETGQTMIRLQNFAVSRTAGIWRIKRSKIILGFLDGLGIEKLVTKVRVPPESIVKCLNRFAQMELQYFDHPERKPTKREMSVEHMLAFLEASPAPGSKRWRLIKVRYIGHDFTAEHISKIRKLIASHSQFTRNEIAKKICKQFGFRQANGNIKLAQTNQILRRMEMDNLITLPTPQKNAHKSTTLYAKPTSFVKPPKKLTLRTTDINRLQFIPVLQNEEAHLWRYLINKYHYIKESLFFGAQMRYLIFGGRDVQRTGHLPKKKKVQSRFKQWKLAFKQIKRGEHLLAVLGFAASSWRLASRDRYIGWTDEQREANLKLVVNNARFLIMPWIYSPNLASRILGGIAKQLPLDWEARYNYQPVLLETFVQLDRFKGTCYQAANWIEVGKTEGYSLFSSYKRYASAKAIYVYPLRKNFRRQLCRL